MKPSQYLSECREYVADGCYFAALNYHPKWKELVDNYRVYVEVLECLEAAAPDDIDYKLRAELLGYYDAAISAALSDGR